MKTRTTTDNRHNFGIISQPRRKENHRYKNQNRHKGDDEIQDPKWIEIHQKICDRKTIVFDTRCLTLDIDD